MTGSEEYLWWQRGVIYQVYPRSFRDANGDGTGDLAGIAEKLPYLAWLGVDAIWLSPIFTSPMADFGYDVSDYTSIDPLFGDLADFDTLLDHAHQQGLKIILDLVPNHTSDEHPWFVESRSSRTNSKRDWYLWADARPDGGPPNNWESMFGGESAWQLDEVTGQYYLRTFDRKQPDLNWRNPAVRDAIHDVMRFWLERGVDGFRIDVLSLLIKDERLRDNPVNPTWQPGDPPWAKHIRRYTDDQPGIHQIVQEFRHLTDGYPGDRVLIGELYLSPDRLVTYYGEQLDELHLPFNFGFVDLDAADWTPAILGPLIDIYERSLPDGAWPNWVLANHDSPRPATRLGADQARVAQMLLLTLRGTPTCYYGDEIGMTNVDIPPDRVRDPQAIGSPGYGRDPARTPMQWDTSPTAGFTEATPWLPIPPIPRATVQEQTVDPASLLAMVRRLLQLRRSRSALAIGTYRRIDPSHPNLLAYSRQAGDDHVLVVLNLGSEAATLTLPTDATGKQILCATHDGLTGYRVETVVTVAGYHGLLIG